MKNRDQLGDHSNDLLYVVGVGFGTDEGTL